MLSENHNEQAVIISGDFNVTSEKIYSVYRYNILKQVFNDWDMVCGDYLDSNGIGYTYIHDGLNVPSYIDNFFFSNKLTSKIASIKAMNVSGNLSDHLPVECILNIAIDTGHKSEANNTVTCESHIMWDEQSKANYCYVVTKLLDKELLFLCECVGKCNYVSPEKKIRCLA